MKDKLHSVPTEAIETAKIARIGRHSDFGSITLLLQDDVGSLEVEGPNIAGTFWVRQETYMISELWLKF